MEDRRSLIAATYANGNLGGDDMKKALAEIDDGFAQARRQVIEGTEYRETEQEKFEAGKWWEKK